jgi:TonB-linked SusC/RagA family outer membrane protein
MTERLLKIPKPVALAIVLGLFPSSLYPQTFAGRKTYLLAEQRTSPTLGLRDAILELKNRYHVNILFEESLVDGLTISETAVDFSRNVEQNLHAVLQPNGLDFQKVKKNAYVVVASEKPAPKNEVTAALPAQPVAMQPVPVVKTEDITRERVAVDISGRVLDENGQGMPGVNVLEKGTANGTTTDASGDFRLNVDNENSVLVFSFIGYTAQEVTVGSNTKFNISLQPDIKSLEEVVVVAYGTKSKKDLTGSISYVGSKDIEKSVALSPQMAMRGTMPGVFVTAQSGDPNSAPTVRIRGVTTFSGKNADPLYVVDGVIMNDYGSGETFNTAQKIGDIKGSQNIFNLISPADIESISVLKDASSAAAYGSRGANGVILITTKKGKEGRPRINFNVQRGVTNVARKIDMMNTGEYVDIINKIYATDPNFVNNAAYNIYKKGQPGYLGDSPTYDWQDAIKNKNGKIEDYSLSVSGATDKASYYLSGGYAYQESNIKFNNQKRYSLSTNLSFKPTKFLEVGQTLRTAYTDLYDNRDNTGVPISLYNVISRTTPWQPIYDSSNPFGYAPSTNAMYGSGTQNWLAIGDLTKKTNGTFKTVGNVYAKITPIRNLNITGSVGADYFTNQRLSWGSRFQTDFIATGSPVNNTYQEVKLSNFTLMKRLAIDYTIIAGEHTINLYAHGEDSKFTFRSLDAQQVNNGIDDPDLFNISGTTAPASYYEQTAYINYVGRLSYRYKDKYYLDGTILRQGSSRFNPNGYQWGTFPSVSVSWRASSEEFMSSQQLFTDLRFKAGVGKLGNSDVVPWQYLALVNNRFPSYITGANNVTIGSYFTNLANPTLTWETLTSYNAGFESTLFNKLSVSAEYYVRVTDNIIQGYDLPGTVGVNATPVKNIGSARNSGVELTLGYKGNVQEFTYNIGANFTTTKNRVTKLNGGLPAYSSSGRIVVGDPMNSIYGYEVAGVIKTQEQLDAYKAAYPNSPYVSDLQLGDLMYKDIGGPNTNDKSKLNSGSPDGVVDNEWDNTARIGKTIPGYFYGINLGGEYKGFDVSIQFQGVGDVQRINVLRKEGLYGSGFQPRLRELANSWSPDNTNSNLPRLISYGASASNNNRDSDRWVENASFLRLANIQIGYSLPSELLGKTKVMDKARVFISASNLFTITKYTGLDPENDYLPPAQIVMAGLNFGF